MAPRYRRATRFRGYDLDQLQLTTRDFVCKACSNSCDMKEFVIEGQKSYWGDKCSDKFRKPSATGRKPVIEDLFAYREQLLEWPAATTAAGRLRVGIPRAMTMLDRLPFWRTYFHELGIDTVLSQRHRRAYFRRGNRDGGGAAVLSGAGGARARAGAGRGGRGLRPGAEHGGCRGRRPIPAGRITARGVRRCRGCCAPRPRSNRTSTNS